MWFLRLNSCAKCNFRVSMGKGRSSLSLSLRHVYFYIKIERFSSVGGSAERVGAFSPAAITFPRAIVFVLPSSTIVRVLDPLWSRLWVSSMRPEVVRIDMLQELDQGVGVIIVLSFLFEHPRLHAIFHARFDADRCVFRTSSILVILLSYSIVLLIQNLSSLLENVVLNYDRWLFILKFVRSLPSFLNCGFLFNKGVIRCYPLVIFVSAS